MIETWKDSWFEEGLRVFYVLPRLTTDEVLPLTVEPLPKEFVRRTRRPRRGDNPQMEKDVRRQVGLLSSEIGRDATRGTGQSKKPRPVL